MQNRVKFKNFPLVASVIFGLLAGTIFFFVHWEIKRNIRMIGQAEIELQREISKREEIKRMNNYLQSIEKEKAAFETHFIPRTDIVPFLDSLESLAGKVGTKATVSSIKISEDGAGLLVSLRDTGDFSKVYKFLTLLENSPYQLEFVSVDLHRTGDQSNVPQKERLGRWEMVLQLKLISFI